MIIWVAFVLFQVVKSQNLQCPCVFKPGTQECYKYDSRFQATNMNEAMAFFDDLSLLHESKPAETMLAPDAHKCRTKKCFACERLLKTKLKNVGLFNDIYRDDGFQNFIEPFLGTEATDEDECDRYRFARTKSTDNEKRGREKRLSVVNSGVSDSSFIGTRYTLSCLTKGTPDESNNDFMNLCSLCWAWRQLPDNYFPKYVNELICHTDKKCLSGYATCGEGSRVVEVIRNDTKALVTVSLSASSFCECQVKSGSPLEQLVTGSSGNASKTLEALTSNASGKSTTKKTNG